MAKRPRDPLQGNLPSKRYAPIKEAFPGILAESMGIVTTACKKAGIHHDTYHAWRRGDPEWAAKCDVAYDRAGDFVESKLYELINEKNAQAVIFYCKTKLKNRGYVERTEQSTTLTVKHEDALKELE